MKGPSIAVMLGTGKHDDEGEEHGEPGLAEAKSAAKDASKALAQGVKAGDADAIYRAFHSLSALCKEIDELEDAGEADEEAKEKHGEEDGEAEEKHADEG